MRQVVTAAGSEVPEGKIEIPSSWRELPFGGYQLSVRLTGVLKRAKIRVFGDLHGLTFEHMSKLRNCGKTTIHELGELVALAQGKPSKTKIAIPVAESVIVPPEKFSVPKNVRDLPFADLPASARLQHLAESLGIQQLGEFHGSDPEELMKHGNCGRVTINDLRKLIIQAASGEFNLSVEDQTRAPARLLKLLEAAITRLAPRQRELMTERLGGAGRDPLTLEEIGQKRGITREGIRQKLDKAGASIRTAWGPRIPVLFEIIKDRCFSTVCPLTPELLAAWIGRADGLTLPWHTHVRLISLLDETIPVWSKSFDTRFGEAEENHRFANTLEALLTKDGPRFSFFDAYQRLRKERGFRRLTEEEFLGRLRRMNRVVCEFADPENPNVRLPKVSANYIATHILEDAEKPLGVDEVYERAIARWGAEMVHCDVRSVGNVLGSISGVHLVGTGLYGLARHFVLSPREWPRVRNEFAQLLKKENRPLSTYEIIHEQRLSGLAGASAHEVASMVRDDPRFTDLGYLLFALSKWGVEERQLIRDLIPEALREANRLLTAQELGEKLRRFRSVSPHTVVGVASKCPGVRDFGFGYFGLESWGDDELIPILQDAKAIEKAVLRADLPLRFGDLCQRFGIKPSSKLASHLWNTCASVPEIIKHPNVRDAKTSLHHKTSRLDRAAVGALQSLGQPSSPAEIKTELGKLFGSHFGNRPLTSLKDTLRDSPEFVRIGAKFSLRPESEE